MKLKKEVIGDIALSSKDDILFEIELSAAKTFKGNINKRDNIIKLKFFIRDSL